MLFNMTITCSLLLCQSLFSLPSLLSTLQLAPSQGPHPDLPALPTLSTISPSLPPQVRAHVLPSLLAVSPALPTLFTISPQVRAICPALALVNHHTLHQQMLMSWPGLSGGVVIPWGGQLLWPQAGHTYSQLPNSVHSGNKDSVF